MVKNTLYRRKNDKIGGNWKEEKAYKLEAGFGGQITDQDCNPENIAKGQTKNNQKSQTYDYGVGHWYKLTYESLGSYYNLYIKNSTKTDGKYNVIKLYRQ